jgi:hypothetical protein
VATSIMQSGAFAHMPLGVPINGKADVAVGCSLTRDGIGEYTLLLSEPLDERQCIILVSLTGTLFCSVSHASDTVKGIFLFDETLNPDECAFAVEVRALNKA